MSWKGFDSDWLSARGGHVVQCAECAAPFVSPPSKNQKFCSPECAYKNPERINKIADNQRKDRGTSTCPQCGEMFALKTGGGRVYCSRKCSSAHVGRITMKANRKVSVRTKEVEKTCPTCGNTFKSWASNNRIYCGPKCSSNNTSVKIKRVTSWHNNENKNHYSRALKGWVELGERRFYAKSRWEANYGRYLEWLRLKGEIKDWKYEAETFWFEGIQRGVLSYLPDFKVTHLGDTVEYHEVKGWMDSKSKTKLKRMKKYHPSVILRLFDTKWFRANSRTLSLIVPGWEKVSI